ncbi:hypothetical protein H6F43_05745 [Leptolyngbya sp. FACHB-36]|uniref:hypothetical protein n=1 Tax=Leptolyngbya sp. FACHB-36 TaxID=2692808 RepID=UPI001681B09F|nr:hypothetical protein [Leptolyngbya sp. FACHB-36]MBD2019690.1 hypothetical protein [Leptolyngbya sp. FACHB-36]
MNINTQLQSAKRAAIAGLKGGKMERWGGAIAEQVPLVTPWFADAPQKGQRYGKIEIGKKTHLGGWFGAQKDFSKFIAL